jgi:hypothetical protein
MVSQLVKKIDAALSDKVFSALGKSMYEDGGRLDCDPCGILGRHQRFGRIYCLHLED